MDLLVEVSTTHLVAQIDAGADTMQIFDSWAGVLPTGEFERWCIKPIKALVMNVRAQRPDAKIIGFPRGASIDNLIRFAAETGVDGLSLDTVTNLSDVKKHKGLPVLQGNLDPLALVAGGEALDRAIDTILDFASDRPYIFNLGHGILPETPIAHVEQMIQRIRK